MDVIEKTIHNVSVFEEGVKLEFKKKKIFIGCARVGSNASDWKASKIGYDIFISEFKKAKAESIIQ